MLSTFSDSVRAAREDDFPELINLARMFGRESVEEYVGAFDETAILASLKEFTSNPDKAVLVYEKDGRIAGWVVGFICPSMFNFSIRIAMETAWYVHPDYRNGSVGIKLFKAFETWAKVRKANKIVMVYLENSYPEQLKKIYQKLGFRAMEHHWVKEV